MCTARSEGYRARAREKNSWKKQGRCKGHGGSYGGGRGRGRGWVAVSKERGWISNMLRQMRRPTVVCHSFSLVSLLFLSSAACFPIFPSLSRTARSAFKHPPPRLCARTCWLFPRFSRHVIIVSSVLHARQEFTYSRATRPRHSH